MPPRRKAAPVDESYIEFTLTNVNGIQHARIRLDRGKIAEFRGRNGSGKSSALDALRRYCGDDSAHVEVLDGADAGSVEGPGPTMLVTDKVRMKGDSVIPAADRGGALIRLITGEGLKGEKERNRARIKALAELVDVPADDDALNILCGGDEETDGDKELRTWIDQLARIGGADDLFTAAARLKPQIDTLALAAEKEAAAAAGRAESEVDQITRIMGKLRELELAPVPEGETPDHESARHAAVEASLELERRRSSAETRRGHEQRLLQINATLGTRPDIAAAEQAKTMDTASRDRAAANVQTLERQLAEARQQLAVAEQQLKSSSASCQEIERQAKAWDDQKALLGQPTQGASDEEVLLAELAVTDAQAEEERHRLSAELRQAKAGMQEAREEEDRRGQRADFLRRLAKSLPDRVGEALGKRGLANVTVVDGRLAWKDPTTGDTLDWDTRMSTGQRIRAAFALAAEQLEGIVFLPSDERHAFYLLLDPDGRRELDAIVAEMGLFCATEVPAAGELQVVHRGGEAS